MWPFRERKPPEDWRDTGKRAWRTYETAGGYAKQYRAAKWVRFPDGETEWRAAEWDPSGCKKLRVIEVR